MLPSSDAQAAGGVAHTRSAVQGAGALGPVFAALSAGLHLLVAGLGVLVAVRALEGDALNTAAALVVVGLFEAAYAGGILLRSRFAGGAAGVPGRDPALRRARRAALLWLSTLTLLWAILVVLVPDAAFLVFPLFFLCLHLLPRWWGPAAVVAAALVSVGALAGHRGLTVGGITGPLLGAAVAIAIGLGYSALFREVRERQRLLEELLAAQARLADSQRLAGVQSERTRMAAELHDTVAQGLSSIQLLLSAAERRMDAAEAASGGAAASAVALVSPAPASHAVPVPPAAPLEPAPASPVAPSQGPGRAEIALAKRTAADSLAEARAFIRALSSPTLAVRALPDALERLCTSADATADAHVRFRADGAPHILPRAAETTLLRIVQGALGNAVAHARAAGIVVTLTYLERGAAVDIVDDGVGFDPTAVRPPAETGSFGLGMMRKRAEEAGGRLVVESAPGRGTAVSAVLEELVEEGTGPAAGEAGICAGEAGLDAGEAGGGGGEPGGGDGAPGRRDGAGEKGRGGRAATEAGGEE
ncbi:sensor histidine kinase [Brevibacterium album]|uniref:sensor histidine kinase n=1 Tax=Brevibacterium album TaxID=417948 RepID=UPI000684EA18|nr:sensor histidine kinase [Brevibacterium album]